MASVPLALFLAACAGSEGGSAPGDTTPSSSGATGQPIAGMGGSATAGSSSISDDFVSNVSVSVHDEVSTILVVTWTQTQASEQTWLEFSFEGSEVMTSRPKSGQMGEHRDVVLGVPGDTPITLRIVNSRGGTQYVSSDYRGTTGSVPAGMPVPEVAMYEPTLASPERYLFGSVEDSQGNLPQAYLTNTFWLYIMDRQGRIVWYYADIGDNATSSFQRVARDGEYIWIEKRCFGCGNYSESVLKRTLDGEYTEEVPVEGLADCIDVTDDGSLLYDASRQLRELSGDGSDRVIFSCPEHFGQGFNCYTNTVNWSPADDTVLMSYPEENTVIQVSRQTGDVVGQYGAAEGSWAFAPPRSSPPDEWGFGFQHFPNISPEGTLMVSSHMPGYEDFNQTPTPNQHAFLEFEIDRQNQMLIEKWRYTEGPEWARSRGMAIRLANGNTLANYGTGGVIREITPDKQTVFYVKFDIDGGDDFFNKLVGNNVLIDDLYALNGGGPE